MVKQVRLLGVRFMELFYFAFTIKLMFKNKSRCSERTGSYFNLFCYFFLQNEIRSAFNCSRCV